MNANLRHMFCISAVFGLCLSLALLAGAPKGTSSAMMYSLLLPLGLVCPLVAGGCLLHDRLERSSPWAALAIRFAGLTGFWGGILFLLKKHWTW